MKNNVKKIMFALGIASLANLGIAISVNQTMSRSEYIETDYHAVTRPEGLFGSTTFKRFNDQGHKRDEVFIGNMFPTPINGTIMVDGGKIGEYDGLVDELDIIEEGKYLMRKNDFEKYRDEFKKADKILSKKKKEFQKYFEYK